MKYLVDTNVWMDVLLGRPRVAEASQFLSAVPATDLAISKFSVFSVGFYLKTNPEVYGEFISDLLSRQITIAELPLEEMHRVVTARKQFALDFDDAVQYAVAEYHALTVISYDADFDRTLRGRKTPAQVMP